MEIGRSESGRNLEPGSSGISRKRIRRSFSEVVTESHPDPRSGKFLVLGRVETIGSWTVVWTLY